MWKNLVRNNSLKFQRIIEDGLVDFKSAQRVGIARCSQQVSIAAKSNQSVEFGAKFPIKPDLSVNRLAAIKEFTPTAQSNNIALLDGAAVKDRNFLDSSLPLAELDAKLYKLITTFASVKQSPVSIDYLIRLGTELTPLKSLLFDQVLLHNELPIRIARVVLELDKLPAELLKAPSLTALRREYVESLIELVEFPRCLELEKALKLPALAQGETPHSTIEIARLLGMYEKRVDGQLLNLFPKGEALKTHLELQRRFVEMLERIKHRHRTDILRLALGMAQYKANSVAAGRPMIELNSDGIQQFFGLFNRRRIGIRLLQGQHIALMRSFERNGVFGTNKAETGQPNVSSAGYRRVGIIDPECDIVEVIESSALSAQKAAQSAYSSQLTQYGACVPDIHIKYAIQGPNSFEDPLSVKVQFPYVPSILYHVIYELLKNSLRATMEKELTRKGLPTLAASAPLADESQRIEGRQSDSKPNVWWRFLLPVAPQPASGIVTAADEQRENGSGLYFDPISIVVSVGKEDMMIKVSDMGGGISRQNLDKFGSFMYSSATPPSIERLEELARDFAISLPSKDSPAEKSLKTARDLLHKMPLCGLGYGIPMSKLYAAYLGGCLEIVSMEGFGTDAYLYLRKVGDVTEDLRD